MDFSPGNLIQVLRHRIRGGVKAFDDLDDTGAWWVVHDLGNPDDIILEPFLIIVLVTCITLSIRIR